MTTIIKQDDLITSIKDALQFISYYHPQDFIQAMSRAYDREENKAAKDAIAQILINSRMCAEGHRPICQDTGIVNVFLEVGLDVKFDLTMSLDDAVNEGVRQGYLENSNVLRASVLADPAFGRKNTKDNTPAVIHYKLVPGNKVDITVAAKGGGSENKSKLAMLNPSDSIVDWVLKTVPTMGAGWCPPGMLGIGIGGTAEKAMMLAKEALKEDDIAIGNIIGSNIFNIAIVMGLPALITPGPFNPLAFSRDYGVMLLVSVIFALLCWRRQRQIGKGAGALLTGGFIVWMAMLYWLSPLLSG